MLQTELFGLLAFIIGLLLVANCVRVCARMISMLRDGKGKVDSSPLGFPDILVVSILGSWLGGLAVDGFLHDSAPRQLHAQDIVQSVVLFSIVVAAIIGFLTYRGISAARLFGLHGASFAEIAATAGTVLLAAYPLIILCTVAAQKALGDNAKPQEIMEYFSDAARNSDRYAMITTVVTGIFVAPALEELLFRGYIYGTLRRYIGPVAGMILSGALFALIHVNGVALPALFVLAICLTLAYEATGSLLAPMAMHATFNAIALAAAFAQAHQ